MRPYVKTGTHINRAATAGLSRLTSVCRLVYQAAQSRAPRNLPCAPSFLARSRVTLRASADKGPFQFNCWLSRNGRVTWPAILKQHCVTVSVESLSDWNPTWWALIRSQREAAALATSFEFCICAPPISTPFQRASACLKRAIYELRPRCKSCGGACSVLWVELRSIADPDSAELPAISIPVSLANHSANGLFDINWLRRIVNRRKSRPCCESAAEQRAADKPAHYASGNLTILRTCRSRQPKRPRS